MKPIKKLPKSISEYAAALTKAKEEGSDRALAILLYVLADKYGWDMDQLFQLRERMNEQLTAINEGYASLADIIRVMEKEYQIGV